MFASRAVNGRGRISRKQARSNVAVAHRPHGVRRDDESQPRTTGDRLCLVPLRPPIRTYKSSPHFRHQLPTNVQWKCVPQNLNLQGDRKRVTTGPWPHAKNCAAGDRNGETYQLQFLDDDAAKQRKLDRSRQHTCYVLMPREAKMIKRIAAIVAAAGCAALVVSVVPEVAVGNSQNVGPPVASVGSTDRVAQARSPARIDTRTQHKITCTRGWPYYEKACLDDGRQLDG